MSVRPISAEPVNVIFRSRSSAIRGSVIVRDEDPGTTFSTPGGRPAARRMSESAGVASGASFDGFTTVVHPAATADATGRRLLHQQEASTRVGRDSVSPVDPHRLLRKPEQVFGGIADLVVGLVEGLAHLEGQHQRKLLTRIDQRVVRAPEDRRPVAGRARGPRPLRRDRGGQGVKAVRGATVGELAEGETCRGVLDSERAAGRRRPPLPVDEQATWHGRDRLRLGRSVLPQGRHEGGRYGGDAITVNASLRRRPG